MTPKVCMSSFVEKFQSTRLVEFIKYWRTKQNWRSKKHKMSFNKSLPDFYILKRDSVRKGPWLSWVERCLRNVAGSSFVLLTTFYYQHLPFTVRIMNVATGSTHCWTGTPGTRRSGKGMFIGLTGYEACRAWVTLNISVLQLPFIILAKLSDPF